MENIFVCFGFPMQTKLVQVFSPAALTDTRARKAAWKGRVCLASTSRYQSISESGQELKQDGGTETMGTLLTGLV